MANLRIFYILFHIFMFTMLLVGVTNNLGLWIAIEMTTLVSALLMILYTIKSSVEVAWKYMIICTVGITFALFGTILTYYGAVRILGESGNTLNWTSLIAVADQFDPTIMKLAFIFILIGYGTKAGLAPMHTWLPDAHSEAPTPVSALLSGVLLNCAMCGIIRFYTIATKSTGEAFTSNLLIVFGLLSIGIAVPFIILQEDYKRMLAYSSVEHMGIIALGIGFGGVFGIFGAILHMFNHAMTKSLMFFGAGNVLLKHQTKEMDSFCGECARVCPPGVIWFEEESGEKILSLSCCGCIFCGRCEEACRSGAVRLTQEYELASKVKEDLVTSSRRKL